jgi:hypothetical protein
VVDRARPVESATEGCLLVARDVGGGAPRTIVDCVESAAASRPVFAVPRSYPAKYAPIASATANVIAITGTAGRRAVDGAGCRCGAASTRRTACAASRSRASAISRSSGQTRTSSGLNGSASSRSTHVCSVRGPRSLRLAHRPQVAENVDGDPGSPEPPSAAREWAAAPQNSRGLTLREVLPPRLPQVGEKVNRRGESLKGGGINRAAW